MLSNLKIVYSKYFTELISKLAITNDETLLEKVSISWKDAKFFIENIKNIFLYMDKNYILPKKLVPVKILGY